jgi:membrane protein
MSEEKGDITIMEWPRLFLETIKSFIAVRGMHHGAAIAYYTLFALVPLFYISLSLFGRIIGQDKMTEIITDLLHNQVGVKDVTGILEFLNTMNLEKGNTVMEVVGLVTLLITCTAILVSLKNSLNTYMGIDPRKVGAKKQILRGLLFRLISIALIGAFTLVIIMIYFAQTVLISLGDSWLNELQVWHWIFSTFSNSTLSVTSNLIIFTMIFRYVHDGVVRWKLAFIGAIVTSLLLFSGHLLIRYYLTNFFFAADGGIAGSLLVVMVWVFYTSQIIFFGARFIAVYAERKGLTLFRND